jgi:tetratricopeptide (TPR) repeat protein
LELANQAVQVAEEEGAFLAEALGYLAEVHAEQGDLRQAISALERAVDLPGCWHNTGEDLERYRTSYAPRLATSASVDALLASEAPQGPATYASASTGELTPELSSYLEARRWEAEGQIEKAIEHLGALVEHGPLASDVTAILGLARCLARSGQPDEALELIEARCLRQEDRRLRPWAEWLRIASSGSGRDTSSLLDRLGALHPGSDGAADRSLRADVEWALRSLATTGGIRLNCGGKDYVDSEDRTWGRDRFFTGGAAYDSTRPPIQVEKDQELYYAHRHFWERFDAVAGYRIPIPCGRYSVVLHFCATSPNARPSRFGIRIEGRCVREPFDPVEAHGFGVPFEVTEEVEVADGALEIVFTPLSYIASVNAIVVERR